MNLSRTTYELKYTEEISNSRRTQVDRLQNIVESTLNVKILSVQRFKENVDGRIIFTKILFDMGMPISYIARMICKNHATTIYYCRKFDNMAAKDSIFRTKYYEIKDRFFKEEDISLQNNNSGLIKEVYMLRDALGNYIIDNEVNSKLKAEIVSMKETIRKLSLQNEKLQIKMGLSIRPKSEVSDTENQTDMHNEKDIERARIVSSIADDLHESINDIYETIVDKEYDQAKKEIKSLQSDLLSLVKYIDNDIRNSSRPR